MDEIKDSNLESAIDSEKDSTKGSKKGKGGVIALVIILILAIAGGALYLVLGTTLFLSPKQKVMLAFSKAAGADSIISILSGNTKVKPSGNFAPPTGLTIADYNEIRRNIDEKGIQATFEAKVKKAKSDEYPSISAAKSSAFAVDYLIDRNNRKAYYDIYLRYMAIEFLNMELFVDDSDLGIALGKYLDGYISFNTETFSKDYMKSDLYSEIDEDIPDISFNLFDMLDENLKMQPDYSFLLDESGDSIKIMKNLYDAVDVEETGAIETFEIGNKDVKCKEYKVTLSEKHVDKFADAYSDFLKDMIDEAFDEYIEYLEDTVNMDDELIEDLQEEYDDFMEYDYDDMIDDLREAFVKDYSFYVYLDNKCRLIDIFYEETFDIDDEDFYVCADFAWHGGQYLFDDFEGKLIFENDDEELAVNITNVGESTKDGRKDELTAEFVLPDEEDNIVFTYVNDKKLSGEFYYEWKLAHPSDDQYFLISAEGKASKDKEFYEVAIDNLLYESDLDDGKTTVSLEAFYSIGTIYDEIPSPKGHEYKIFKMSIYELEDLIDEISDNAEDIFGGFF